MDKLKEDEEKREQEWNEIVSKMLENSENGTKWKSQLEEHEDITYENGESLIHVNGYNHAAHAFLWSPNPNNLWGMSLKASILMQMRFDGTIGFPGGFVEKHENTIDGLNRELNEEICLNSSHYLNQASNYLFSNVNHKRKLVLHFYAKQFELDEFKQIELESIMNGDYGREVQGLIRPILFETDKKRGFSSFVQNQFIGNALIQLVKSIFYLRILTKNELLRLFHF